MNKTTVKSIGAILAGFFLGAILSMGADFIMEKAGMMSQEHFKQSSLAILLLVIGYRIVFNVMGCYLTASLAPNKPMKHVIIIGIIGTVLSIAGALAMWEHGIPFYNISIILISLPSAWLGGKLYLMKQGNGEASK